VIQKTISREFILAGVKDMKKGHIAMGLGVIIFSVSLFISHAFGISNSIIDFIMGFGCGVEIVGVVLMIMENRKKSK